MNKFKFFLICLFLAALNNLFAQTSEEIQKRINSASPSEGFMLNKFLAEAYIREEKPDAAVAVYEKMLKDYEFTTYRNQLDRVDYLLAFLYQDYLPGDRVQNNLKAAGYYKRLIYDFPESQLIKEAYQNAIYDYKLCGQYAESILLIDAYIKAYPNDKICSNYKLEKAFLLQQINQDAGVLDIYRSIVKTNSDDSLGVEAYCQIGSQILVYDKTANRLNKALEQFESAIALSEKLQASGKPYNMYFYVEALFHKSEIVRNKYEAIELKGSVSDITKLEFERNNLFKQLMNQYDRIMAYGHKRYGQARLLKIRLLENFGDAKYRQEFNGREDNFDDIVYRKEIYNLAAQFYDKAIDEYQKALPELKDFLRIYTHSRDSLYRKANAEMESYKKLFKAGGTILFDREKKQAMDDKYLAAAFLKRYMDTDETITLTQKHIEEIKHSIIRMQYTVASSNYNIAAEYLKIRSEFNVDNYDSYYERLYLIDNTVIPHIEKIQEAYQKTISLASQYGVNNEWVDKSKQEIVGYSDLLTKAYDKILKDIYGVYNKYIIHAYKFAALGNRNYRISNGDKMIENEAILDEMSGMINYAKTAAIKSIVSYGKNLDAGASVKAYDKQIVSQVTDNLLSYVTATADLTENARKIALENYSRSDSVYYSNQDLNPRYGIIGEVFWEQGGIFSEMTINVLSEAYNIIRKHNISNEKSAAIIERLLILSPALVVKDLGLPTKKISVSTGTDWLANTSVNGDFYKNQIDLTEWREPYTVNSKISGVNYNLFDAAKTIWIKNPRQREIKTITARRNALLPQQSVFFRKEFDLDKLPVKGLFSIMADNQFILIINENTIVRSEDLKDQNNWKQARTFDVTKYLQTGKNSIVIVAADDNMDNNGLIASLDVTCLQEHFNRSKVQNR